MLTPPQAHQEIFLLRVKWVKLLKVIFLGSFLLVFRSVLITFVTALALLTSSAFASVQATEPVYNADFVSSNDGQIHLVQCPKLAGFSQISGHHCCASICLLKLPTTTLFSIGIQPLPTLMPRAREKVGKIINRSKTLFRPPIA